MNPAPIVESARTMRLLGLLSCTVLSGCAGLPWSKPAVQHEAPVPIIDDSVVVADIPTGTTFAAQPARGPSVVDLVEVVRRTLAENPEIGIAAAQVDDAQIAVDIERTDKLPVVDLSATAGLENTYTENSSTIGADRAELNLSVEQVIYNFGATDSAIARRVALVESAALRERDAAEAIALELVRSYLNYVRNAELASAAGRNVATFRRIADLVALNEEAGNATEADVNRALTNLESARSDRVNAENARDDAAAAFRRLAKLPPEKVSAPGLFRPEPSPRRLDDLRAAVKANPELQSLLADRASLVKQLRQQQAALKPEIFLRGEANYSNNVGGFTGRSADLKGLVGLRTRLYDGGRRKAQQEQIRARIREVEARYQRLYEELLQQAEQNAQSLDSTAEKAGFVRDRLAAARRSLALAQEQFEAGERTAFELLDAQRDLYLAEQEQINTRIDAALDAYENLRVNGTLVAALLGRDAAAAGGASPVKAKD